MKPRITSWIVSLAAAAAAPLFVHAGDWYRWRGPEQDGVSREHGVVDTWDPTSGQNVLWKNEIGSM